MSAIFHLIRHGRTVWNEEGRAQGHADSPLTENAIYETQQKAVELAQETFDAIYSSDLGRTQHTAKIIGAHHPHLTIKTTSQLRERHFGDFEGKPFSELDAFREQAAQKALQTLPTIDDHTWSPHPDMESSHQVATRVLSHLVQVSKQHDHKTTLIVTHGGVLTSILVDLKYATNEQLHGKVKNLSRVILIRENGQFRVEKTPDITI
ncbi:MAG: histidine phosphatase family protein [Patescibacteria group bacterium]